MDIEEKQEDPKDQKNDKKGDEKMEEEPKKEEPKKEEPKKPKTRMVKKKRTDYHTLKVDDLVTYRFSKEEFDKYFEIESTMNNEDILILETHKAKNDLEALCYKYQEKLDEYGGELKPFMPKEE